MTTHCKKTINTVTGYRIKSNLPGNDSMHDKTRAFILQEEVMSAASFVFKEAVAECRRTEVILLLMLSHCSSGALLVKRSS